MPRGSPSPDLAKLPGSKALRVCGAGEPLCVLFSSLGPWQPLCSWTQRWGRDEHRGSCQGLGSLQEEFSFLLLWHVNAAVLHACF